MSKTCYCGVKSSKRTRKYALLTLLLAYVFVKRNVHKKGHGHCTFSSTIKIIREVQVNLSVYKALILDNKQLLSNTIDYEATQVSYTTRIAFLVDSYIFCSNYPAILFIIAIASYILLYKGSTFEQKFKVASCIDF